ncbi:hypothetical protein [Kitasatospora sp. NPDC059599]|uniref:hypothetical protein n=1 Tax=Kitasatospora sp. NPDC059599 TaxID=3346880 RepID=UPI0036C2224B
MTTHNHYDADGNFAGSSQHKGDRIENFDELGRQVSTSWLLEGRIETNEVGGGLVSTGWEVSDQETEVRGPTGEYLGKSWDSGTHADHYDADGDYDGSSW